MSLMLLSMFSFNLLSLVFKRAISPSPISFLYLYPLLNVILCISLLSSRIQLAPFLKIKNNTKKQRNNYKKIMFMINKYKFVGSL